MSRFHPLQVTGIRRETRDSVVVTLKPREQDTSKFFFIQGQYLTFRRHFDGQELRRSYSICSGVDETLLKVGVKRVDGGAFSTWINEELQTGDIIETMPPMGNFFSPIERSKTKFYLGFAGGSGITPVLSIIKTVLMHEKNAQFTLFYANRNVSSIMFREELADLKNQYMDRFSVVHILESEQQEVDFFFGLIDASKMKRLFETLIEPSAVDMAFICGPEPMMLTIADGLRRHGLSEDKIKFELFSSSQQGKAKSPIKAKRVNGREVICEVSLTIDGLTRSFKMPKAGDHILDVALTQKIEVPYACKAGVCSTCRAKLIEGEVEMESNHALEDYEVRAGYVLSCQCLPLTDKVSLTYDE
ncbi:2Fe-2S iron-sulfur cluster-binding protein [Flexibacterium corallicola]|uniref:2Fe-2S iron-sulfur cluster-binding protein n=1 Tax=Flexibacterium corallicola TaxID=3037259 RepID=UPI00286F3B8F|nr:2Fe-2S iron-sulfur cluster-binding protein [Pseudovibrio sp. M1P-2-3]